MTLKEIMERCNGLDIDEQRSSSDDYNEVVFYNKDMDGWSGIFSEILGSAIKPAGKKPDKEALSLTEGYGGICDNQTLFKKDFDDYFIIAMFWPWQDNSHTTLKIVLLKK